MTGQHQPRRGGSAALLALPLLCCAGHALLLALGAATSLGALLPARAPLIVLVGLLVLLVLGLAALAAIRSPRRRPSTCNRTRSEQS